MAVARTLYVGQKVEIVTNNSGGLTRRLPVQSANCEVSRPIEDILSFGRLGSLGRVQNSVSTCKADIKSYIPNVTGTGGANDVSLFNTAFISALTGEALAGTVSVINVVPNGFVMSGILASIGIDISQGSFASADMSFVGVGEPIFHAAPGNSNFTQQSTMPTSFSPVTSSLVSGQATAGCANSFKFSLELPNEVVSCLGGVVTGSQGAVKDDFLQVAKPPFKASISVEGTAVDAPTAGQLSNDYVIGKLSISLPSAQITSRSFNNAVGQVGATYNYTLEDVSADFEDVQ